MAVRMSSELMKALDELRYEPTAKRVRATLAGRPALDSTRALLVWEPRRIVPSYAVPADDVLTEIVAAGTAEEATARPVRLGDGPPVLDPRNPFAVHTTAGQALVLDAGDGGPGAAGFRIADPALAGYIVVDFGGFDGWLEEDEPIVGHPHDPFSRIDVRRSARQVRIELDGHVLAETSRSRALFETGLPTRYYLPRDDVRADLRPSSTRTVCAYKGEASYWSVEVDGREVPDVAWSYEEPLDDLAVLRGLVCFFAEKTDLVVDGRHVERPITPWSASDAS
jgi:uncharacterized protein (DUF427 family)